MSKLYSIELVIEFPEINQLSDETSSVLTTKRSQIFRTFVFKTSSVNREKNFAWLANFKTTKIIHVHVSKELCSFIS